MTVLPLWVKIGDNQENDVMQIMSAELMLINHPLPTEPKKMTMRKYWNAWLYIVQLPVNTSKTMATPITR